MAQSIVEEVRCVLARYPQVSLAILYGSYARGVQTPASDIDIALLMSDRSVMLELSAELSRRLRIPEERVSLVDLSLVDPLMRARILCEGVKLTGTAVDLMALLPSDPSYVEVCEDEQASSRSWLRGDPVDLVVVREIVAAMEEDVRDLQELLKLDLSRVVGDRHLRKSLERTVHTLIESMIDLLRHIVSGMNLGVAAYYRDYVNHAERGGVISQDTASDLKGLIPLRHVLVHRYRGLDYEKLWERIPELIKTAGDLVTQVRSFLKAKLGTEL